MSRHLLAPLQINKDLPVVVSQNMDLSPFDVPQVGSVNSESTSKMTMEPDSAQRPPGRAEADVRVAKHQQAAMHNP